MQKLEREIVIVLGRTGQGKSVWTRQFLKHKSRIFVFDPLMDVRAKYGSQKDLLDIYDAGELVGGKIRLGISSPDDVELLSAISFIAGDAWLVIEEASFLFPPGGRAPEWLREPIFLGRHRRLSILITAQRPTSIPVDLRSQASRIVCFSQHERRDTQWLDSYFLDRADQISDLSMLECLDVDCSGISRYSIDYTADDKNKPILAEKPVLKLPGSEL